MIQTIKYAEYEWFLWLNSIHSPVIDTIMYWVTYRLTWIPLYAYLIFYIFVTIRKNAWQNILFIIISVGLSDRITSGLMKPYFQRLRPCHDPLIQNIVHVVGNCGGEYGFVSSHAANSFAVAIAFALINTYKENSSSILVYFLFLWAILVSYSRIYVGVHYPTDLLIGGLVGIAITLITYIVFLKFIKNKPILNKHPF